MHIDVLCRTLAATRYEEEDTTTKHVNWNIGSIFTVTVATKYHWMSCALETFQEPVYEPPIVETIAN